MLDLKVLGSSSTGNCYLINTSKEVLILECGVHYKRIFEALNYNLINVVGCLVTHEHADHSKSFNDLAKSGIEIYSSAGTLNALGVEGHRIHKVQSEKQFRAGNFIILPFEVQHDAAEPLGYLIYHPEFGKLLFATDTYYIKYKFNSLNYIMVECNYSKKLLDKNIHSGNLIPSLRKRLLSSHFSLENVIKFLKANDLSVLKGIMLMHLSNSNSNANEFKEEIETVTGVPVTIC